MWEMVMKGDFLLYLTFLSLNGVNALAFHSDTIFDPEVNPPAHLSACFPDKKRQCESEENPLDHLAGERFSFGFITTPVLAAKDEARAVWGNGGDVYVLGHANDGSSLQGAIVRYEYDGTLDTAFSTSGKLTFDATAAGDLIHGFGSGQSLFAGRAGGPTDVNWMVGKIGSSTLDTSFWTRGYRVGSFYPNNDEIFRAVNRRNNNIVAGYAWRDGRYNFVVAKFLDSGDLDTSFNTSGFNLTTMSAGDSGALSVSQTYTDAGVLVGGPVHNGANWDFGFARYLIATGELDTTFSTDGMATHAVLGSNDKLYGISVWESYYPAPAVGYAYNGANNDFAVVRVRSNGSLDTSFNTTGKVTTDFFGADDVAFGVTGAANGLGSPSTGRKVIAVGSADNGGNLDIAMARYISNGALDTSFHTDGKATFDIYGERDVATAITVGTNAEGGPMHYSVSAQVTNGGNQDFALLRVETNGTLAQSGGRSLSFGTSGDGTVVQDIAGNDSATHLPSLWVNFLGIMYTLGYTGSDIFVSKYGPDHGVLDTSFNTTGTKLIDLGGTEQIAHSTSLVNGWNLLGVGNNGADFLVVRLFSSSGNLDTSFATQGYVTVDFSGTDLATHLDTGTGFIVGKDGGTPSNFAAILLDTTSGALNTSFHTDGKATYAPTGNAAQAKFAEIGGLYFIAGDDGQDFVVVGLQNNGSLSTSFHTDGVVTVDFGGVETMGGGASNIESGGLRRIFLAGGDGNDFHIARVMTGGQIDTTFNTSGKLTLDFGTVGESAKAIFNDGYKTVVVGDDGNNFLFARLNLSGELDTSFNTTGKKAFALTGASTLKSISLKYGKYCVSGSTNGNTDAVTLCINP